MSRFSLCEEHARVSEKLSSTVNLDLYERETPPVQRHIFCPYCDPQRGLAQNNCLNHFALRWMEENGPFSHG